MWAPPRPWHERRGAPRWLLVLAIASATLAALSIVSIDRPIARTIAEYEASGLWDRGIDALEHAIGLPVFPWTAAIVLALAMVVTSAVRRWRGVAPVLMLVVATHVVARIVTLELKLATGRLRPYQWLTQGADSFGHDGGVSFPSGHVTLFSSLVIPLVVCVPRAWPMLVIAIYPMLARVAVGAHFVSDVLAAIAVVTAVTYALALVIRPRPAPARPPPSPR